MTAHRICRRRGAMHLTYSLPVRPPLQVLWIATTCLLLSASGFQPNAAIKGTSKPTQVQGSLTVLMAESTYKPNQWDLGPFLAPLFQQERSQRRNAFSERSTSLTRAFPSSNSREYDDSDDEHLILSYLPDNGSRLTPKTKELMKRITKQYVFGDTKRLHKPVMAVEVEAVILEEYKFCDLPVEVNGTWLCLRESKTHSDRLVVQVLSFAALNGLPKEITLFLLAIVGEDEIPNHLEPFEASGWSKVAFPHGLPIQRQRRFSQEVERYFPMPRSWATSRKQKTTLAEKLRYEASVTPAPIRLLQTKEAFLLSMSQALEKTKVSSRQTFRDALEVFPRRRRQAWRRITRFSRRQADMLASSGRAGIVAHSFINFVWYTVALISQWRQYIGVVPSGSQTSLLIASCRHFARSITTAFIGAQLMKLPRIMSANAISPMGKWVLQRIKQKQGGSEVRALKTFNIAMMAIFILVSTTLISADAIITRVLQGMYL